MIPMTSVEVLQDVLKFAKDLLPLLTEKKLDTVIAGLAEARATVDNHKAIQVEILAAQEKLAKAEDVAANNAMVLADIAKQIEALKEQPLKAVFQPMKVYVWHDFSSDWTPGLAVVIAGSEEQPIKVIKNEWGREPDRTIDGDCTVYDIAPMAFCRAGRS